MNGITKRADRAATIRSQCINIVVPTPIAAPFTAAISGFCNDEIAGRNRLPPRGLLLLGEPLDAATACDWGLVNRVVDDAALLDTAREMARRLAALPPQAVRLTKRLIKHGAPDVAGRIQEEIGLFTERLASPEAQEAFAAFMEKRQPDFTRFA